MLALQCSWHNLKNSGEISLFDGDDNAAVRLLLPGHYTLETSAKEIENLFSRDSVTLHTKINTPVGQMVIQNPDMRKIVIDRDLAQLLGINRKLLFITFDKI